MGTLTHMHMPIHTHIHINKKKQTNRKSFITTEERKVVGITPKMTQGSDSGRAYNGHASQVVCVHERLRCVLPTQRHILLSGADPVCSAWTLRFTSITGSPDDAPGMTLISICLSSSSLLLSQSITFELIQLAPCLPMPRILICSFSL